MAVRNQTDRMFENNDRVLRFSMTDEDNGGNLDLTVGGRVSRFALARFGPNGPVRSNPIFEKVSTNPGEIVLDPSSLGTNVADVMIMAADVAGLAAGGPTPYYFEFEIVDGGTSPLVLATGTLVIDPNVENV